MFYQCQDYVEPLCIIKGRSIGAEYTLDKDHLAFGGVIIGCESKLNVKLQNTGEIGVK